MKHVQETAAPRIDRERPPAGRQRGMKCVVLTARPVAGSILVMDDDPEATDHPDQRGDER